MLAQENEEVVHIRPACVECTHRCNLLHGTQDPEEEKFDPDRSFPHFRRRVSEMALHHSPQAALCIPASFWREYPNSVPKNKPITLKGPSGNQWKVEVVDRSALYTGWRAFSYDHRLKEDDQLYFRLTKPSHFVVDILNKHGEVRRSAKKAKVTGMYATPSAPPLVQGHSRKRKLDMTELAGIGKSIMSLNIVDRRNTPAKRGVTSFHEPAAKLRFSEETKQWESHEEKDGRGGEVVTIDLDSDDEKTPAKSSKLEHFLGQAGKEEDEEFITLESKAFATHAGEDQKVVDAKIHQEISSDGEEDYVVRQDEPLDEEEKQRPSDDPLRQFSKIFDTTSQDLVEDLQETTKGTAAKIVVKAKMEKEFESASDPYSRKAQILCDEDMVTVKEEEDSDSDSDSELDKSSPQACVIVERKLETNVPERAPTPKEVEKKHEGLEADKATKTAIFLRTGQHSGICDNRPKAEVLQSFETPLAYKAAAADNEPVTAHNAVDSSPVTIEQPIKEVSKMHESTENSTAEDVNGKHNENSSPGQMQEEEGGFSSGLSPDNDIEYPVVINSIDGDQTDSKHPLKQGLKQAGDEETLKQMEEDDEDLIESKTSYSIFEAHELDVTKTAPGTEKEENPNMPVLRENVKEKETVLQSNIAEFTTPENQNNINIQARVASTTDTCVLESKRWEVFPSDRERALKAAQACVRRIRNPNFMTVMKSSQVYTDFIMDVPADFAKHSNLPSDAVRVTLVCDEVPTNCKSLWLGSQSQLDCKGWRNFSRSHCLEEGDVCVFECYPPATPTMTSIRLRVQIFRLIQLSRFALDWTEHYKVLQGDDDDITGTANASPAQAQARTPGGANQAHEAFSKEKSSVNFVTL